VNTWVSDVRGGRNGKAPKLLTEGPTEGTTGRGYEACGLRGHGRIDGQGCEASGDALGMLGRELRGVTAGGIGEVPSDGL
jgi:hypothetical protein